MHNKIWNCFHKFDGILSTKVYYVKGSIQQYMCIQALKDICCTVIIPVSLSYPWTSALYQPGLHSESAFAIAFQHTCTSIAFSTCILHLHFSTRVLQLHSAHVYFTCISAHVYFNCISAHVYFNCISPHVYFNCISPHMHFTYMYTLIGFHHTCIEYLFDTPHYWTAAQHQQRQQQLLLLIQ